MVWLPRTPVWGFFNPGFWLPDTGNRDILLSGDIESNPGPLGNCSECGGNFTVGSRPIRCRGGCGRQTHKRVRCSALRGLEAQRLGNWRCAICTGGGGQGHGGLAPPVAPVNSPSGLRGGLGHGGLAPPVAHVNSHGGGGQGHGGIAAPVAPVNSPSGLRGGQGHGGLVPPVAPVNSQGGGGQGHGGTAAPVAPANSPSSLRGGQGHGGLAPPVAPVNSLNGRGGQGRGGVAAPVAPVNSPGGRDQQRRGVAPPSQSQRNAPSGVGAAQPAPAGPNPRVVRRTCPACKEKLRAPGGQAERLVCECCRAEFHKKRECSGLTRHQVRVWQTSGRWTCIACSNQRRQDAANAPGVAKATDPT